MTPDPAAPGDVVRLHLSNVIGPMCVEPGATASWNVAGSVGHWGHVHQRKNQYRAEINVSPIDGVWKLVDLEILEEERL